MLSVWSVAELLLLTSTTEPSAATPAGEQCEHDTKQTNDRIKYFINVYFTFQSLLPAGHHAAVLVCAGGPRLPGQQHHQDQLQEVSARALPPGERR